MGFKDASGLTKQWVKLCGGSQHILYETSNGDSLPDQLILSSGGRGFDASFMDIPSYQFMIFNSAQTGVDVLKFLQHRVNEDVLMFGARRLFFCFDNRRLVTEAKLRERALRQLAQHGRTEPYTEFVQLKNGRSIKTDMYEYALTMPMPNEFSRVIMTPALLARAVDFIVWLLLNRIEMPPNCTQQIVIVIDGIESWRRVMNSDDTEPIYSQQSTSEIGEAESQCYYWMRAQLASGMRRFLVRANDSDALALGLMNVPQLYSREKHKLVGELWLDLTSGSGGTKFYDVKQMWRRLKKSITQIEPENSIDPIRFQDENRPLPCLTDCKPLQNDIETLMVVSMMCGNDYCLRMPQLGAATVFKFIAVGLIGPLKRNGLWLLFNNPQTGELYIDEKALMAFIARLYVSIAALKKLLLDCGNETIVNYVNGMSLDRLWLYEERRQRRFFDMLASVTNATQWAPRKKPIHLPDYDGFRAHVRRAFYSLHYFLNVVDPNRMLKAFATDSASGLSLYGHEPLFGSPIHISSAKEESGCAGNGGGGGGDGDDDGDIPETERGLAAHVLLKVGEGEAFVDYQPFVKIDLQLIPLEDQPMGTSAAPPPPPMLGKRSVEEIAAIRENMVKRMRDGPRPLWLDSALRHSFGVLNETSETSDPTIGESGSFLRTPIYSNNTKG